VKSPDVSKVICRKYTLSVPPEMSTDFKMGEGRVILILKRGEK
jgi:hypothetical protein